MMGKVNYKTEFKRGKQQIAELTAQVTTLKDRLDVLRKAKNQTILKTEIVNRNISEPVFGQAGSVPANTGSVPDTGPVPAEGRVSSTRDVGVMTTPPSTPPPAPEPSSPPAKVEPKRFQRKRTREAGTQCRVYTDNTSSQVSFTQPCHCEGPSTPEVGPSAVSLPKIKTPCSMVGGGSPLGTGSPRPGNISRMKTNEYISLVDHNLEIVLLETTFKTEREKQAAIHSREVGLLRQAVQNLNKSLKSEAEESVKQQPPNGASVFHLYAEEKRRMEEQVRHVNLENHKLRSKLKKIEQDLKEKEEEMEDTEEAIKKTWDSQYRAWITKTEKKMSFLRSSNENMQSFIMKNARHLPFAATDELKIFDEYGQKVSVFQ